MYKFSDLLDILESKIADIDLSKEPILLYRPIEYLLSAGGKRMRPALTLMTHNLYNDDISQSLDAAIAVELFHNFTLLHDDIMDNAPVRRGKPTVNNKWDNNVAILSGDTMTILAYQFLARTTPQHLPEVMRIFNQFALEICEGQRYDMDFESREDVTIGEYVEMIRLKTSVLLAGAMEIGALLGGASEEDSRKLYKVGESLGLAFQLADDYLDTFGDQATFGKRIGGDIIEGKRTFLYITTLERAPQEVRSELRELFNSQSLDSSEKIERVKSCYTAYGADKVLQEQIMSYYNQAISDLESVSVAAERKEELFKLAKAIIVREK